MRLCAAIAVALVLAAACSTSDPETSTTELVIAIDAPFTETPYVGETMENGVGLGVDRINERGGIETKHGTYTLRIETYDNALSSQRSLENVRTAIDEGAIAVVTDGTGVDASWREANRAHVPICIVYQGGVGLVDLENRPNVFRIAPTDHGIAFRFAEYLDPQGYKVGFLHDDSPYGRQGKIAFDDPFGYIPESVAADIEIATDGADYSPQILEARRAGSTALLVWATSPTIATVVRDVRSSGWEVPIFTPPAGADPLVRQQLADHPEWVEGLTFASGRMTAEVGPGPFLRFQDAYESKFGRDETGVETSDGDTVYQPPEYGMYPFDFVNVLAAAIEAAPSAEREDVLAALERVAIRGANGDERGFNENNHEGVVDDDVYFAVFHDMTFAPVEDDPLSASLDVIPQT